MASNTRNRLLLSLTLGMLAPLAFAATAPPARHEKSDAADQKDAGKKAKSEKEHADARQSLARMQQDAADERLRQAKIEQNRAHGQAMGDAGKARAEENRQQAELNRQRADAQRERADGYRQQAGQGRRDPTMRNGNRLSAPDQQRLISQQRSRVVQYRAYTQRQQQLSQAASLQLQQQRRTSQYRYYNDYNLRLRAQQIAYRNQNFNYDNDPYFYSAPSYRYQRDGRNYEVNQYGANMLRQAINAGYSEGFHVGRADRMDNWRSDYRNSYAYQDGSYGYSGYYLERSDYTYYFREGFRRGYDDGYRNRSQYGRIQNGNYSVLGTLISSILNLQSY